MLTGMAAICFIYAPLLLLLRAPPTREEKKVGIDNPALVVSDNNGAAPLAITNDLANHTIAQQETVDTKL